MKYKNPPRVAVSAPSMRQWEADRIITHYYGVRFHEIEYSFLSYLLKKGHFSQKGPFFSLDSIDRTFANTARKMDSSSTLESSVSLLSNAPSLATIRTVLVMLQHERFAPIDKIFGVEHFSKSRKYQDFSKICPPKNRNISIFRNILIFSRFWKKIHSENFVYRSEPFML